MKKPTKKKFVLGLALGSGAVRGFAHVGVLKAFEEEGLEFDVVAGTSIGSVIGSLYAKGYSSDDMLSLFRESELLDSQTAIAFALGFISLEEIINRFVGGAHFSDLKKQFKAVAVDADKGVVEIMSSGDLASALSASCAVPPIRPICRKGKNLVDGAFLNATPADVVKEMGADFIVSVNLNKGSDTNQTIKSALDEIYPSNKVPLKNRIYQCYGNSDIVIEPNLSAFSPVAVNELDKIYKIGYDEAKSRVQEIKETVKSKLKG